MRARTRPETPQTTSQLSRQGAILGAACVCALAVAANAFGQTPGKEIWQFAAGGEIHSSPAIGLDGTIYFGARDNKLYAINPDGTKKWDFTTGGWVDASPAIAPDGAIYVGSRDGQLYAVSTNGTQRWAFPTVGMITQPAAVAADGTVYFTSSDGQLYAVDSNGGKKWQFTTGYDAPAPSVGPDGTIYVSRKTTFVESYDLYALNPDGTTRWKFGATGAPASCAIDFDGTVYPGGKFDQGVALTPDGFVRGQSQNWQSDASAPLAIGPGDRLYSCGTNYVGESAADGRPLTATPPTYIWPGEILIAFTPVALSADGVVCYGGQSNLEASSASDLTDDKWFFHTGGLIFGAPTIGTNGVVYFGSTDDNLYAIQGGAGPAASAWPMYRRGPQHTGAPRPPTYTNTQLGLALYPGISIQGNIGSTYRIEYADRLGDTNQWSLLATVTLDRTPYLFIDTASKGATNRFYRAILVSQ